jgi:hypothetical protein
VVGRTVTPSASDLHNVQDGITRRLYTITGENDAYLINWERHEPALDDAENYIDHIGEVSELTYQSYRKLLVK